MLHELRVAATAQQIAALGQRMFAESRFSRLGFDRGLADGYAQRIVNDRLFIGFGAFEDQELTGMVVGICGPTLPFTAAVVAHEHLLFIAPEHRSPWLAAKLIQAFIAEAKARGARDITFSNGTGYQPERVGKLFEICGLSRVGGLYVLEV